jgi:hypothetical protein
MIEDFLVELVETEVVEVLGSEFEVMPFDLTIKIYSYMLSSTAATYQVIDTHVAKSNPFCSQRLQLQEIISRSPFSNGG